MFISVSETHPNAEPSKYVTDVHVSLEQVIRFFTRQTSEGTATDMFLVKTVGNEYYVTKETYDLLKSLVLRP